MVNVPRHNVPLNRLADRGIYPREKGGGRDAYQYFALPRDYKREEVVSAIETYLYDMYEARGIQLWQGRTEHEVKATWQE